MSFREPHILITVMYIVSRGCFYTIRMTPCNRKREKNKTKLQRNETGKSTSTPHWFPIFLLRQLNFIRGCAIKKHSTNVFLFLIHIRRALFPLWLHNFLATAQFSLHMFTWDNSSPQRVSQSLWVLHASVWVWNSPKFPTYWLLSCYFLSNMI